MKQEDKKISITLGELKDMKIWVSEAWVKNLFERGQRESGMVKICLKDLITEIAEKIKYPPEPTRTES